MPVPALLAAAPGCGDGGCYRAGCFPGLASGVRSVHPAFPAGLPSRCCCLSSVAAGGCPASVAPLVWETRTVVSPDACLRCYLSDVFALHSRALHGELRMKWGTGGLGRTRLWPGFKRSGIISPSPRVHAVVCGGTHSGSRDRAGVVSDLRKSSLFASMTPLVAGWASSPDRPIPLRPFRSDRLSCPTNVACLAYSIAGSARRRRSTRTGGTLGQHAG